MERSARRQAAVRDGKHPVSAAAGPYGHPIHPIAVTIPIGAWVCSLLFDVASRLSDDPSGFTRGAYWLIAIGIAGAAVAAATGLLDLLTIPAKTPARRTALAHMALNVVTLVAFAGNFAWRYSDRNEVQETRPGQIALTAIALVVLSVSGYLGGKLAYRYGVRVVTEPVQADAFRPSR